MSKVVPFVSSTEKAPEFITPASIADMSEEQVDDLIRAIRLRRTNVALQVAEAQGAARRLDKAAIGPKIEKLAAQMQKELDRIDKAIESVLDKNAKVRALRLQEGDL